MLLIVTKYAVTAFVIVLASEVAKRSEKIGALVASFPIVTLLVMIWLYVEGQGTDKLASYATYTFWYVIPTLPMFLVTPACLQRGWNFWLALATGLILSTAAFAIIVLVARRFGVDLLP